MVRQTSRKVITRNAVMRAFAGALRSDQSLQSAVNRYMGACPVPPIWSLASMRGEFGRQLARKWARHLRHLHPASYRSESGGWLVPVVQTLYDFGLTREELATRKSSLTTGQSAVHPLLDEFWRLDC